MLLLPPHFCRKTCSRHTLPSRALLVAFATGLVVTGASGMARAQPAGAAAPAEPVTPPTVVTHVDAVYPPSALDERRHGDVVLALTVDADGHVSKVDVIESGGSDFDEAAVVAARQWTFVPAKRAGKPLPSRIRVPFHFAPPAPPPELVPEQPHEEPSLPQQPAALPQEAAAGAKPPSGHETTPPETEHEPDENVYVTERRTTPNRGASDFNVRIGEIARVPRQNSTDLLKLAPGVFLANEGGEGHAEQIFLRGFDAREGQDIEFSVGGVPINESGNLHGDGYADTHFIIPELVSSVRIIEGPFDPRQGNYAVAGSANYELGLERRGLTAKYTTGSFGTQRLLLTWGPKDGDIHTFGGAEIASTNGFGQNRDALRGSAMGQYEGHFGKSGSYRLTGTAYSTRFHSAGVIRDDDYRAGRIGFYDSYSVAPSSQEAARPGGTTSRYSISGDVQTRTGVTTLSQQVFVIQRDMRIVENFTGFLLDPPEQRGDNLDLHMNELTLGARGSSSWSTHALGQAQELEIGYFARGDRVAGLQQRLAAATGAPYKTEVDTESTLGDIGLYADASLRPIGWVTLRGGVRTELLTFDVNDLGANAASAPQPTNQPASTAGTAVLPRASILLEPVRHVSFDLSYGRGVRSADPTYVVENVKAPLSHIDAYEGAVVYARDIGSATLTARSIFFLTHVDKDLVFSETEGRNVLGPGTTRTGWAGAARLTGGHFDEAMNMTLVRATSDDTHLPVSYVPGAVFRSDTAVFSDLPLSIQDRKVQGALSAGIGYVGTRPLPAGARSDDIFTVDLSATLSWTHYELGFIATNLFDNRYRLSEFNYASDFRSQPVPVSAPTRHFTAGTPRGLYATFAVNFAGP